VHSVEVRGEDSLKGRVIVHFEGDAYLRLPPAVLEAPDESAPPLSKLTAEAVSELVDRARQFLGRRVKGVAR
jgi:hypothetical protein